MNSMAKRLDFAYWIPVVVAAVATAVGIWGLATQ